MSKVLVDRELLERIAHDDEGAASLADFEELKRVLAQPAEAEGVEVVGYAVTWIRVGDTPEETVFMSAADFEATGGPRFYSYREPLTTVAQHLAALSTVTAERDRVLQEKGDPAGSFEKCMQAMRDRDEHAKTIDQLRAEVEALRKDAERWRYVSLQGDDTHWLNLLRVDLEDFGGNINAAVDALIDGEAPAMSAKEA